MTWHLHRWSRWRSYDQWLMHLRSGRTFIAEYQCRECEVCGKRQERPA